MMHKFDKNPILGKLFKKWTSKDASAREVIGDIIGQNKEADTSLDPEEKLLLSNILHLRDLNVADIMTPRADIEAIPVNITFEALEALVVKTNYSRLPVYGESLDELLGCFPVKDLAKAKRGKFNCRDYLVQVLYVPQSAKVLDLLIRMKAAQIGMVFVVDEYGGIDGLVTSWDIFRKILGDLDSLPMSGRIQPIAKLSDHSLLVDGRTLIEDLAAELPDLITDKEIKEHDTISGFVIDLARRVPSVHELIEHNGVSFEIIDADARRIKQVRIFKEKASQA